MVKYWSNGGFGVGFGQFRRGFRQTGSRLVKYWANGVRQESKLSGRAKRSIWKADQTLVERWSNTGRTLVKH
jgi:hypothetical protein